LKMRERRRREVGKRRGEGGEERKNCREER
jgi:hypothetical protein